MAIQLTEDIVGIWFVNLSNSSDWMSALTDAGDSWLIEYRFRYYADDSGEVFDTNDEKRWRSGTALKSKVSAKKVLKSCSDIYNMLVKTAGTTAGNHEVLRGDKTFDEFMEEFMALDCVHAKKMSKEEAGIIEH